ncbi:hypothetical protein [Streptosporangium sp. CA-115845]|uniref:hypothetical protein n=1 Tax=Streptosporangium sp. CA-115845 TaxID=3240071 RepID=UPI003D920658
MRDPVTGDLDIEQEDVRALLRDQFQGGDRGAGEILSSSQLTVFPGEELNALP